MVFVESLQLELPDAFPAEAYGRFMSASRDVLLRHKDAAWTEFAGASNLIGWRFKAAYDHVEQHLQSWRDEGAHISFHGIYERERQLFGAFTSGVSTVDATCYALFALASHESTAGLRFGPTEQRSAALRSLAGALTSIGAAPQLAATLRELADSHEWQTWLELRNRMAHRTNLPRIIRSGLAPHAESVAEFAGTSSSPKFVADEPSLHALVAWLACATERLLEDGLLLIGQQAR